MRFVHASVFLLVLTLSRLSAQSTAAPPIPVIGTVESVSGNSVNVKTGAAPVTVHVDGESEVWKGKKFHDLSPLKVGDRVFAECRKDPSGTLIAVSIAANVSNFFGIITTVNP